MDFIRKLGTQFRAIWSRWSHAQRVGVVSVVAVCGTGILGILFWASSKEYVTLANRLSPTDAHEVMSALQAEGIESQLNFSSSAVSVPVNEVSRARLAIKDIVDPLQDDPLGSGSGLWVDPIQQRSQGIRNLERRIASTIAEIRSVRSATVHISQPEPSPFIREQTAPTASVVLTLSGGTQFSSGDARAVVSLVSHSVEDLLPDNVTVLDTNGRILSSVGGVEGDVNGQLEYRERLERDLSSKAETLLESLLGHGRSTVQVTAEIDFTEKESEQTSYDPDSKVKTKESISTESMTGDLAQLAAGAPGVASNLTPTSPPLARSTRAPASREIETIDTEYQNTQTVDTVREVPGKVKRLTIAAVVELPEPDANTGGAGAGAAPQQSITAEQIESIIKQAVGFDSSRNDEITVLAAKLHGTEGRPVPAGFWANWSDAEPLLRAVSLSVASLVALIIGMMVIRKLKPVVIEVDRRESMPHDVQSRLDELSQRMTQNPELVASVFSAWLDHEEDEDAEPTETRKAA